MDNVIAAFRGRWTKLGNYSSCVVFYDGHAYPTVEHAYQASKFTDPALRKAVRNTATPNASKKLAHELEDKGLLRADWKLVNIQIMWSLLREKFSQEPERSILLSTGDAQLIEGNWWGDTFWGQCPVGTGENWLGRLLMDIRKELLAGTLTAPSEAYV